MEISGITSPMGQPKSKYRFIRKGLVFAASFAGLLVSPALANDAPRLQTMDANKNTIPVLTLNAPGLMPISIKGRVGLDRSNGQNTYTFANGQGQPDKRTAAASGDVAQSLAMSAYLEVGTWKLNVEASLRALPGDAAAAGRARSATVKIERVGDDVKFTIDQVDAEGIVRHYWFLANYDAKDSPVVGNDSDGDSVGLLHALNPRTILIYHRRKGKATVTDMAIVSQDGKQWALVRSMNTPEWPQGKYIGTTVYDRQQ
jgi:hypothetical protein